MFTCVSTVYPERSKERDRRARKKRGFTSEPDIETARKHRRAASSSSQPVDMKREATRLTFHSLKLPVNLLARYGFQMHISKLVFTVKAQY